jgi:putative NADPH-quinone reductase
MRKRIFILNGHPAKTSLNHTFAETYAVAARTAGHDVRVTHLYDLNFDLDYEYSGYAVSKPLEPGLETMLCDIEWSEHVVLLSPMWWGGIPAKLKGAFDRALLPGRAFDTRVPVGKMPNPMLGGRSARVILTSDTPRWVLTLIYRNPIIHQLRQHILGFVGITPTRVTYFAGASHPRPGRIENWIKEVNRLGTTAA